MCALRYILIIYFINFFIKNKKLFIKVNYFLFLYKIFLNNFTNICSKDILTSVKRLS